MPVANRWDLMSGDAPEKPGDRPLQGPNRSFEIALPRRTTPALLLSLLLHVTLLTTLGLIWSRTPRGTGEEGDRPVGIALVHRLPDRDLYVDAAEIDPQEPDESSDAADPGSASSSAAPPADLSPPIDLNGILKAMESTPSPRQGTGLAGEAQLDGDAFATGRGPGSSSDSSELTTNVFGVSGSGSRFVYVFDRSDSMNGHGGKPLRAAKAELLRSLDSLSERQRFQIVFYNHKPTPFRIGGMPLQMMAGESSLIARAQRYVRSVAAFGGTEHAAAIKLALKMSPDVIFFLTDARIPRLSHAELREIQRRAELSGTAIHTIEFGPEAVPPADNFLRELAAMNNGQYQYIDVRRLGTRTPKQDAPTEETP